MGVSRDEARELAIIGLLVALGLRVGAGLLQALDEARFPSTTRSILSRFFAEIGSTVGMLTLGAVLLAVLSPRGSVTNGMRELVHRVAGTVMVLGVLGAFVALSFGFDVGLGRLWFAMRNGLSAATLAGTGWWIMRHFDDDR
jgi:hypothetical protein